MTESQQPVEKITVDKDRIREEMGNVPGQQADRYPPETHIANSVRMYNVPSHEITGAIAYAQQKDPRKWGNRKFFSVDEIVGLLKEFLAQEDQGHKAALEAREG